MIAALEAAGARVFDYRHPGSASSPVELAAIFASAGDASAPTILFLHGKGGCSAEWEPDALRAVRVGYNALILDLRGHPPSQGQFVTYGFLEKDDLANAIGSASERFGMDAARLGIHSCSAGSTIALEFAAGREQVRALWLESPYADPAQMARHYLSVATGLPGWLLRLTSRWAAARAVAGIRRALDLPAERGSFDGVNPIDAARRVRGRVCVVHGARDRLVPPRFARRLMDELPSETILWSPDAGHCHHPDEPAKIFRQEYERRWIKFFQQNLPVE